MPRGVDQGVGFAGLLARGLDPVGIALGIAELERVLADLRRRQQGIAGIDQQLEAVARADPAMMVAARADEEILLIFLEEDHRVALRALVPEILGGLALRQEGDLVANPVEPAHFMLLAGADRPGLQR